MGVCIIEEQPEYLQSELAGCPTLIICAYLVAYSSIDARCQGSSHSGWHRLGRALADYAIHESSLSIYGVPSQSRECTRMSEAGVTWVFYFRDFNCSGCPFDVSPVDDRAGTLPLHHLGTHVGL